MLISVSWCVFRSCLLMLNESTGHTNYNSEFCSGHFGQTKRTKHATVKFADLPKSFWPKGSDCSDMWKKIQSKFFASKFSQTIMTVVKSQSFCGGQNGLTILAKIIFKSLENIFDHLVRPFWPIFFWESFEFFVATMVNGSQLLRCLISGLPEIWCGY